MSLEFIIEDWTKGRKMKLVLLILAIGMVASTPTSESNKTFRIVCLQSSLLLQVNQNGSLNCMVKEMISRKSSTMSITVTKDNNICGKQIQKPVTKVRHSIFDNQTNIVEIFFRNISWQAEGSYLLSVTIGNVTKVEHFSIQVYDVPTLPKASAINYTTYFSSGSETFAFYAILPKKQKKCGNNMTVSYTASYRIQNCSLKGQTGSFECKRVPDSNLKDRDIECFSESLLVCQNEDLSYCRLDIQMTARSNIGNSTTLNFTSKRIYTAVNLPVVYIEITSVQSRSLKISWPSPCYVYSFLYTIKYNEVGNSTVLIRKQYSGNDNTEYYSIANLQPATEYRICVGAENSDSFVRNEEKCIYPKTLEDVPSRPPKITGVKTSQLQNGNLRWKITVSWKLPNPRYWNGKAHVIVEYTETRKPNDVTKSQKLSTNETSYILDALYSDRDYYVHINLCTKIGCKQSDKRYISHLPSQAGSSKVPTITVIVLGIVVVIAIVVFVIWKCRREKSYGELEEEGNTNNNRTEELPPVPPRPSVPPYDEPVNTPNEYDNIEEVYNEDIQIDVNDDQEEDTLTSAQANFQANDNPLDGSEVVELVA